MGPACHDFDTVASVSAEPVDPEQPAAEIASCAGSHAALVAWLRAAEPIDPSTPSLLPGWTIGHVLTHIARNGDGHLDMLAGRPQYPSLASRNDDIESGAARSWTEIVADVERVCGDVDARYEECGDWTGTVRLLAGDRPKSLMPLLRQREVEVHRADLGLGYGFADMPSDYLRKDLRLMGMLWRARKPMGLTPLPAAALALAPPIRLAWMMGRVEIDGLAPADLF